MANKKKDVDWIALEVDYRANVKTIRMLEKDYGISRSRICQVAKERSWERDLAAKIEIQAQAKLNKSILDYGLDKASQLSRKITETEVIEANSDLRVLIQVTQRKDIGRNRLLAMRLLEELESQTVDSGLYVELGELLRTNDAYGQDKLNDLYKKIISTPSRIDSMKKLSETLKTLITLEREVYNIATEEKATDVNVTYKWADPE